MPVIKPKIRGFICTTSHPDGCAAHVQEQIAYVKSQPKLDNAPQKVLVIGSSTGYGLASRIVPAFGGGAATMGVFFEKEGTEKKPGSPGWYNSVAFEEAAKEEGLYARSFNGDAFSTEMKEQVIAAIKEDLGQVDMVVYSLASPRRTDPATGETYRSVLKPTGDTYTQHTLNTDKGEVEKVTIESASEEEIAATVKVMGGEDWQLWIEALKEAGVLAEGFRTVAYSYIGPEITWAVYTDGTIGRAKEHLEQTAAAMNEQFGAQTALVSVNKALVTQASSAIPVVPLYISILYKIMKEKGLHEGTIEQIQRLFADHYCGPNGPQLDEKGRIRIDDWEMREDVQAEVMKVWENISTENLASETDFAGYQAEFLKLFGFGLAGVNYEAETHTERPLPS
ncbi:enoyl-ACP reductase FabV [Roseibacillus ishigakijimensis]|uniref:Enoyl-[acyl-carrier-protein] reductase [NADH] n=1 Tax=Roseibacillus ishigakijimensis TaxID=454146 RepID=A0A934VJS5_9BACT|nr:enoyl-ACP reductase FabV [Roseibacillus ishigakijimensis]MBK1832909.1 trans-2-enoyl-CoA reductase family protein [Roseibacillus ishigakijimensis]